LDYEIELVEAPRTLEDGGQAIINDLIELNCGSVEELHPIYASIVLTPK